MEYQYSVIIPVYNAEKTIQRCLDSLVRQNNGYAQIILINDGSCDNSGAICEEYAAKHACITYVYQKNAGASSARNTGLSVASGKYITFVDSDDYVLDHYFETLSASDADLCVFSYNILNSGIFSSHDVSNLLSFESDYTEFVLEIMRSRAIGPTNKRYLRSIIENKHIRFKKDLVIGEDFIFLLEYMLACKTCHSVPRHLYCVDQSEMNSITRGKKYDFSQFILIYKYAFQIAEECTWDTHCKMQILRQLDYQYCRTSFAVIKHGIDAGLCTKGFITKMINQFADHYPTAYLPALNKTHLIMRVCMKYRILPAYLFIALAHKLLIHS